MKKRNHQADIKNSNLGTSGTNETYHKALINKRSQLRSNQDEPQDFIDESEYLDEGYFAFDD
ncbi:MAG: hypothetical protein CL817_06070 [Croceibacter sp.]|nr:hypothetical protein [Croceibacter sp.]|tara:strand:+ start:298 stop:483 length:186 start_codon:yes stop_codon:yes gene_type:complete